MTCFEDGEDDKNENGDDENKFESKNSEDDVIQFLPKMVENWWRYELVSW